MLQEIYATGVTDPEEAGRNASNYFLDDFIHVVAPTGIRYAIMIPTTPDNYQKYNTTLLGINVTCAVTMADKAMGSLSNSSATSSLRANASFPREFVTIVNETVPIARGYTLLDSWNASTSEIFRTKGRDFLAIPECAHGLCNAFGADIYYALHCGAHAVVMNVTVEKLTANGNTERTKVNVISAAESNITTSTLKRVFNGWSTALPWSWILRGYRLLNDPDVYILSTRPSNVAYDYQTLIAYSSLGLVHGNHSYTVNWDGIPGTGSCDGMVHGTTRVSSPNYINQLGTVVLRKTMAQTTYHWGLAIVGVILGSIIFILLPPIACRRMRRPKMRVSHSSGDDVPPPVYSTGDELGAAVDGGLHNFETTVSYLLRRKTAQNEGHAEMADNHVFRLQAEATESKDDEPNPGCFGRKKKIKFAVYQEPVDSQGKGSQTSRTHTEKILHSSAI
jgi:hypothetical protein